MAKDKAKKPVQVKLKDKKGKKTFESEQQKTSNTQKNALQQKNNAPVKTKNKQTHKSKQPQFSEPDITTMTVRAWNLNIQSFLMLKLQNPLKLGFLIIFLKQVIGIWSY